jgi:anaerobic selenocysteine-containing dehydrogenase
VVATLCAPWRCCPPSRATWASPGAGQLYLNGTGTPRLLSPASHRMLNDSFANDPKIARRIGAATVAMHPEDAAERGLEEGGQALLESPVGALTLAVTLSDDLPRGVVYSPKGRWPKAAPEAANVNVLNPGTPSDMGASTTVHGVEVTVRRPHVRVGGGASPP